MAVADIAAKNLEETKEQTLAIKSLKAEIKKPKNDKVAHESLKNLEKFQAASHNDRKAMIEMEKNNTLMIKRSDARAELQKKFDEKVEIDQKIRDEKQLEAYEEASAIGKLTMRGTESSSLFLKRLIGFETTKQREEREARREAARNKDRGAMGSLLLGKQKDKKGGLFGMLAKLFTGSSKLIKPILNFAKFFLKIGGLAILIAGAIAAAIFFNKSEKEQKKMIDNVVGFFNKIGDVLKKLGEAFGGAFMGKMDDATDPEGNPIEGLVTKFGKFKDAWKKVLDKLSGISLTVGGSTYKGLEGMATMMGDIFGKIVGWFLDIATGVAELITNPTETLAKLQVKIESFFMGIADMLGKVFDKFFNLEFILNMLPKALVRDSWQEDASRSRVKEKQKRIKQLDQDDKNSQALLDSAEKDLKAEQALEGGGNELNLRNLTLAIERSKMQLEANKDQKEYLKEQMLASRKNVIQERLNQRIKQITGIDNQDVLEDIQEKEDRANKYKKKMVEGRRSGDFNEMSLTDFKDLQKKLEAATGVAVGVGTIDTAGMRTADSGITEEFIKSEVGQNLLMEFKKAGFVGVNFGEAGEERRAIKQFENLLGQGIENQKIITAASLKATELQAKLDKDKADKLVAVGGEAALRAKITAEEFPNLHTGGLIGKGGLANVAAGEMMLDNHAVHVLNSAVATGMNLMNLQRDSNTGALQGGSPIIISNAPTTQVNQNQAMILPPSPIQPGNSDGPRLLN